MAHTGVPFRKGSGPVGDDGAVRLTLLGSPWVAHAGRRYDLRLERPTSLLVLLAVRDAWVRRAELALMYRPDAAERDAQAYLRKLVFRARRYPWSAGLVMEPGRLRWSVRSDVAELRSAAAAGDDAAILAAYAGPLLGDGDLGGVAGFQAWLEVERDALAGLFRDAALRFAETAQADDDARATERSLERLRAGDPLDEEVVQAHLRWLLARGRPHAARAVFEAFRRELAAELGLEPLEATMAVAALAAARRGAPIGASGAPPGAAPGVPAAGAAPADGASADAPLGRLFGSPPPLDGALVGRAVEIARVESWWARHGAPWTTIAGLGGVGKTRLALELAQRRSRLEDVVVLVLAGIDRPGDLAMGLASVLGLEPSPSVPPLDQVRTHLRHSPALLVLDDLSAAAAIEVAGWLETLPGTRVLATARYPLELPGEWLVDLAGLSVPPVDGDEPIIDAEAVQLFLARAERRAALPLHEGAALEAVAELCRRVDGLPLALELAAAWTRVASVERLLQRMDVDVAVLRVEAPEMAPRHRDLVAVIDATLSLLTPEESAALVVLVGFTAGFGLEAAERVAGVGLARLLRFVNLGLVRRSASGRYRLHALVRDVVWRKTLPERRDEVRTAVRHHAAEMLAAAEPDLKRRDERAALEALTPELDALRAAWRDAVAARDLSALAAMAEGLYLAWDARGAYHEGAAAFAEAWAAVRDGAPAAADGDDEEADAARARIAARSAYFELRLGHLESAHVQLDAVLATSSGADEGFVLHNLGVVDLYAGRNDRARDRFAAALAGYEARDDAWGASRAAHNLGVVAENAGDWSGAERWFVKALDLSERLGNQRGMAAALNHLGVFHESSGAHADAEAAYRRSLELSVASADASGAATSWTNLGHLAEGRGDMAAALEAYERSVALKREVGDPVALATTLVNLAEAQRALASPALAHATLREALRLATRAGADSVAARAVWSAAQEAAENDEPRTAARLADAVMAASASEAWVRRAAAEARGAWWEDAGESASTPPAHPPDDARAADGGGTDPLGDAIASILGAGDPASPSD